MIFIFICIMPELSQLLVASFSCEPHLYFFTGRYSESCRFRHHVGFRDAVSILKSCKKQKKLYMTSIKGGATTADVTKYHEYWNVLNRIKKKRKDFILP